MIYKMIKVDNVNKKIPYNQYYLSPKQDARRYIKALKRILKYYKLR